MVNITAIVVIAATLAGLALFSMPVPQQASAQACQEQGNPERGSEVTKCDYGNGKCTFTTTPNTNTNNHCNFRPPK